MPDSITPVGTMYPQQNPIAALSSIYGIQQQQLGIQQAQQNLQTGQYKQQSAQAEASGAQRQNSEMQGAQSYIRNGIQSGELLNPDGTFNRSKAADGLNAVAPTTSGPMQESMLRGANEIVSNKKALQDLGAERQQQLSGLFGAVAAKQDANKDDVLSAVETARGLSSDPAYQRMVDSNLMGFPATQGMDPVSASNAIRQHARMLAVGANAPSAEQTNPASATYQGASGVQPYQTNPQAVGGIKNIGTPLGPQGISPQVVTTPGGSLQVWGPGGGGGGGATSPGTPAPPSKLSPLTRPAANAPTADQQNYKDRIAQAGQEYGAVSQAANDPMNGVQATRFRNQQVIDLAPHAGTGPGMKLMNTLASRLPGSTGDAYQDLEHYAAQNSAALAKLMGVPGTNLGAETAAAAAGNTERNPGALLEITKTNDALNTAMDLYNRGLSKVSGNGSDVSKVPAYKQAFGQNLDVNALRWADAHRRGDQQEIQQLQQKFNPQQIAGFTQKLKTLKSLAGTGDLP